MARHVFQTLRGATSLVATACLVLAQQPGFAADALPTGGVVSAGSATIGTPSGGALGITQTSRRAVIDWRGFDIGARNSVTFQQPDAGSATLNRVNGGTTSTIAGALNANGRVYLINPNGIVVTPHGAVRAAGGFVASTLDVSNQDFMAGKDRFAASGTPGAVSNQGTITTEQGGFVALLGGTVSNGGTIEAPVGRVALGSGRQATLDLNGDSFLQVALPLDATDAAGRTLIDSAGTIRADGGRVEIAAATARAAVREAINIPGTIRARSIAGHDGAIVLGGGAGGDVDVAGRLDVSGATATDRGGSARLQGNTVQVSGAVDAHGATAGGTVAIDADVAFNAGTLNASGGTGGKVAVTARVAGDFGTTDVRGTAGAGGRYQVGATEHYVATAASTVQAGGTTQGGTVAIDGGASVFSSGKLDATSRDGRGGSIDAFGKRIDLIGARLDASGQTGGGAVRVGGDLRGQGDAPHADRTSVSATTSIKADALKAGKGGTVVVWSDTETRVSGSLSARGGSKSGDGGLIEISSKGQVGFSGSASAAAPRGLRGTILLDPKFIVIQDAPPQGLSYDLLDPMPADGNSFGTQVLSALVDDLFVITDPTASAIADKAGAVYVFNARTGAVVSMLTGTHANDQVGQTALLDIGGTTALVQTPTWNDNRGAVSRLDLTKPFNAAVGSGNSLVGATAGDMVGSELGVLGFALTSDLLIGSPNWTNPATGAAKAGALTYILGGSDFITGVVGIDNSLVGTTANDRVGLGVGGQFFGGRPIFQNYGPSVTLLQSTSGGSTRAPNFVVRTVTWGNGAANPNAGASTFFKQGQPLTGALGTANSLVGSQANDQVGYLNPVVSPDGKYYLVPSYHWANGVLADAGALTWASSDTGITGTVSALNSLVGASAGDQVGLNFTAGFANATNAVTFLSNGNFVVSTSEYHAVGGGEQAGAVTWGSGTSGVRGVIGPANSLLGTTAHDNITHVKALPNGNYIVASPIWDNPVGAIQDAGMVAWGNGKGGTVGVISSANAVVGAQAFDYVGGLGQFCNDCTNGPFYYPITVFPLTDGNNYLVSSPLWNNGSTFDAGAVTWVNGTTGKTIDSTGTISAANSLVGTHSNDQVSSRNFNRTFLSSDFVGLGTNSNIGITLLPNDNYIVETTRWNGFRGAVTVGNGATGTVGEVSETNSVVGSSFNDQLGFIIDPATNIAIGGVQVFPGLSNFLIFSSQWDNTATGATDAGAVTFVNGTTGQTLTGFGAVSADNSLVGSHSFDRLGLGNGIQQFGTNVKASFTVLTNGKIIAFNPNWDNGNQVDAGAVTLFDPVHPEATVGAISAANSLVGTQAGDQIGLGQFGRPQSGTQISFDPVPAPFYVIGSPYWANGAIKRAGAVTIIDQDAPLTGEISTANSVIGSHENDQVGLRTAIATSFWLGLQKTGTTNIGTVGPDPKFQNFLLISDMWNGGRGAVTEIFVNGHSWDTIDHNHVVGETNSLFGSVADNGGVNGDRLGSNYSVTSVNDIFYIRTPTWNDNRGAVTWGNSLTGTVGVISEQNSLVGGTPGDQVGSNFGNLGLYEGNGLVFSPHWFNPVTGATNAGAITFVNRKNLPTGVVSQANSLVGDTTDDQVGSGGVPWDFLTFIVSSPNWHNDAGKVVGALTAINPDTGEVIDLRNVVSTGNSIVGEKENTPLSFNAIAFKGGTTVDEPVTDILFVATAPGQVTVGFTDPPQVQTVDFALAPNATLYIPPGVIAALLRDGSDVLLQANTDISLLSPLTVISPLAKAGTLTLEAGRSLLIDASITTANGDLVLVGNDTTANGVDDRNRDAGDAVIAMKAGTKIDAGTGKVEVTLRDGAGKTEKGAGAISLASISADTITVRNDGAAGSVREILLVPGAQLAAAAGGNALVLAGGKFTNQAGARALSTPKGRFLVYSTDWEADTRGGVAGVNLYNRTFAANGPDTIGGTQSTFIFARQPVLTVRGNDASKVFGDPNPPLSTTITGMVNGDSASYAYRGAPTVTTDATQDSDVGDYAVAPGLGSLASDVGYGFKLVNGTLTIEQLPVGVTAVGVSADGKTKVYGDPDPALTYRITSGRLVGDDTFSGALSRDAGEDVGRYAIRQGTLSLPDNYRLIFTGAFLAITPATLTYAATSVSRTFGDANPGLGGTVTGFRNGDTLASATGGTLRFATTATATSNVGNYAITGSGLTANKGNYVFAQARGNATALRVNPATLTYRADAASRIYGDPNPDFTGTVAGFKNGDTLASATTGRLVFDSPADATADVGSHAINGSGLAANNGNYVFVQAAGNALALTINPATLLYVANPASRVFGDPNPAFTGTVTGLRNGDMLAEVATGQARFTSSADETSDVGRYAIDGSGLTLVGGNYVLRQAAGNATALTIVPRVIGVTAIGVSADGKTKVYGDADPDLTYRVTSGQLVGDDTFSGALSRDAGEDVGRYAIRQGTLSLPDNYRLVFTGAFLTINPATLLYAANRTSRTYGDANPLLAGSVTGFRNGDTLASATTGTLRFATTATVGSDVGTYAVNGSGLTANKGNYVFAQATGNATALRVNPATLTYRADPASRTVGVPNPDFSGRVTGFKNGDTLAGATAGTLDFVSAADAHAPAGRYAIDGTGLTARRGNYVFAQDPANATALTVVAAPTAGPAAEPLNSVRVTYGPDPFGPPLPPLLLSDESGTGVTNPTGRDLEHAGGCVVASATDRPVCAEAQ